MDWELLKLLNILIGIIVLPYTILMARLHGRVNELQVKTDNVYTKDETKELISLIVDPIKNTMDRLIDSQDKLTKTLHGIEVRLIHEEARNHSKSDT